MVSKNGIGHEELEPLVRVRQPIGRAVHWGVPAVRRNRASNFIGPQKKSNIHNIYSLWAAHGPWHDEVMLGSAQCT
jgi:hypothetical protein